MICNDIVVFFDYINYKLSKIYGGDCFFLLIQDASGNAWIRSVMDIEPIEDYKYPRVVFELDGVQKEIEGDEAIPFVSLIPSLYAGIYLYCKN